MSINDTAVKKLSEQARAQIRVLGAKYPNSRSAILPALHVVQTELGYITAEGMEAVADTLGILRSDVEQVVTFYIMYRKEPTGRFLVKVCDSISCYLRGSDDLLLQAKKTLGVNLNQPTPDGKIAVQRIECLAACGAAPCIQVNDEYLYNVSVEQFEQVLEQLRNSDKNPFYLD
jgi:NADH-quinone oxidoreductase subunit E